MKQNYNLGCVVYANQERRGSCAVVEPGESAQTQPMRACSPKAGAS